MPVLLVMGLMFAEFSILSLGGVNSVLVGMHHRVVDVNHWMSNEQFAAIYAIGRCLPGPSSLFVGMIGWHVAGIAGAFTALVATFAPTSIIVYALARQWTHGEPGVWRRRISEALVPLGVGLFLAGGVAITRASVSSASDIVVCTAATLVFLIWKPNPLIVMGLLGAGGAAAQAAGLI